MPENSINAVIHGDIHGSVTNIIDHLQDTDTPAIEMNSEDRALLETIASHTYIEQYHINAQKIQNINVLLEDSETSSEIKEYQKYRKMQLENIQIILSEDIKEDIQDLQSIFENIKVIDLKKLQLFLGDIFADRGFSDLATLLLWATLRKKGLPLKALMGNHDWELLFTFLLDRWELNVPLFNLPDYVARSLTSLKLFLHYGFFSKEEVKELINEWIESLDILEYLWKPEKIMLCTHAPVGMETYQKLAELFNIPYQDETLSLLCQTLDKIKQSFKESLKKDKNDPTHFLNLILNEQLKANQTNQQNTLTIGDINPENIFPLLAVIWNRCYDHLDCSPQNKPYETEHIHGHHMNEPNQKSKTQSLDNQHRKSIDCPVKYQLDNIKPFSKITDIPHVTEWEGGKIYSYRIDDGYIGFFGALTKGHRIVDNILVENISPYYVSGAIEIEGKNFKDSKNNFSILKGKIQSNPSVPVAFIPPSDLNSSYKQTDFNLSEKSYLLKKEKKQAISVSSSSPAKAILGEFSYRTGTQSPLFNGETRKREREINQDSSRKKISLSKENLMPTAPVTASC